ncbi:RNA-binding protein 7 [Glossina fuscipes]|uniref:RNA-binding protein 7 n=1 Tax=Glossina fuscipes TaxID=7396 RepID=A0A9C5YVM6_9MUSC|nr:RNA-binding protein 7 [Glossina fuscipes]
MAYPYNFLQGPQFLAMGFNNLLPSGPVMLMPQMQFPEVNYRDCVDVSEETDEEDCDEDKRTLFCANLDERVTEDLLHEVFLQAGPIERTHIPKDKTGRSRLFGFITYVHRCSAFYALKLLHGLNLHRKTVSVRFTNATPQKRQAGTPPKDCEGDKKRRSNDNQALRGENYQSFYDPAMNAPHTDPNRLRDWILGTSPKHKERTSKNPFHSESTTSRDKHSGDSGNNCDNDRSSKCREREHGRRRDEDCKRSGGANNNRGNYHQNSRGKSGHQSSSKRR